MSFDSADIKGDVCAGGTADVMVAIGAGDDDLYRVLVAILLSMTMSVGEMRLVIRDGSLGFFFF